MLEDNVGFSTEDAQNLVSLILTGLGIVYKAERVEIQASQHRTVTTTQTVKTEVVSNNPPVSADSTEERLKNIVLSNAASSQ